MTNMKNWRRLEIHWKEVGPEWNPAVHLTLQKFQSDQLP